MKTLYKTIAIALAVFATGFASSSAVAQKYLTKTGHVWFHSEAPLETIEAHNKQVNAALDISSGSVSVKVLIKSFEFEKALMQEHFNESYLESDKFPNAVFDGRITNLREIKFGTDGSYKAEITGKITIHGITKEISTMVVLIVKGTTITASIDFNVALKDYEIKRPDMAMQKIADVIQVKGELDLKKL